MKLDIEIMAEVLPSIRAEIARELVLNYNMNQQEASRILGVSQPAISQYVRQIRGRVTYDGQIRQEIRGLCERLINGKESINIKNELYQICKLVAESRVKNN